MKFRLTLFYCLIWTSAFSQRCDCNLYPIKKECRGECGAKMLQTGTKEQLKNELKIDDATAQKIVSAPYRQYKTSIEEFQNSFAKESFVSLKATYYHWINNTNVIVNSGNTNNGSIQSSNGGIVVTGDNATINMGKMEDNAANSNENNGSNNTSTYSTQTRGGLEFEITGCTGSLSEQTVTVFFTISNPNKPHQYVSIGGNNGSGKAYDSDGHEFDYKNVKLGNSSSWNAAITEIPTGLKARGSITYGNVLPSAKTLFLMRFGLYNQNQDGGADKNNEVIEVHNVKINW